MNGRPATIAVLGIALNIDIEYVRNGFLVVHERAPRQVIAITEVAALPTFVDFLECDAPVSSYGVYKPYIAAEQVCVSCSHI